MKGRPKMTGSEMFFYQNKWSFEANIVLANIGFWDSYFNCISD